MVSDLQTTARTRPHEHHIDQVTMEDYEVKTHEHGVRSLLCCWTIYLQARHRGKHLTKTMQPVFARQCCLNMVHRGCNMKVVFILWEGRSIDSRQCYGFKMSIIKELLAAKAYGHSAEAWEVTRHTFSCTDICTDIFLVLIFQSNISTLKISVLYWYLLKYQYLYWYCTDLVLIFQIKYQYKISTR